MEKEERNATVLKCVGKDDLEIVKITEDLYDSAIELYQKYFMRYENVSIATNLLGSQQSIDEMETLIREIMKDGVSFAAKHCVTNELVAICVNKIIKPSAGISLDPVLESFKSPSMQKVGEYLGRMETTFDLFSGWGVDCVMEIVFLSTRSDFGQRGIAVALSKHSIEFARKMMNGCLSRTEFLPPHVEFTKPQAVCSVFTSRFSQRVGEKLGFETLVKISNKEFVYEGKTFAEKIDAIHEYSTFAALRL